MELIPKNKDKNKSKIFLEFKPLFAKPIINMAKTATKIKTKYLMINPLMLDIISCSVIF